MKMFQHIKIARITAENLKNNVDKNFKLDKIVFYLGSIYPDLNCIYPAHRLSSTSNRISKKIKLIDRYEDGIIKSFNLGIITHYISDYFCYAHNNKSLGIKHREYEKGLNNFFNKNNIEKDNRLINEWNVAKNSIKEQVFKYTDTMDSNLHAHIILEQIIALNSKYKEKSNNFNDSEWILNKNQWKTDIQYTLFMCENILSLILEPCKCV